MLTVDICRLRLPNTKPPSPMKNKPAATSFLLSILSAIAAHIITDTIHPRPRGIMENPLKNAV